MSFSVRLNEYMEQLGCKNIDLAKSSGLSASLVSRYRSGMRTPQGEDTLERLVTGLAMLAETKKLPLSRAEILRELSAELTAAEQPDISQKLSLLMETMDISTSALANALNYDSSGISRIRSGQRKPANLSKFVSGVTAFVLRRNDAQKQERLAKLLGCDVETLSSKASANQILFDWLCSGSVSVPDNSVSDFVAMLDSFDLDEYIASIHFNDLKVPTVPFTLPGSKYYYGVEQFRQAHLDFFKTTALSASMEPVFMCADIPMEDMVEDPTFMKNWMFGVAASVKKGRDLTMIHTLDRPFKEMMVGLQSWIPLYMTGQVFPYYLPDPQNKVWQHALFVSGAAALSCEGIEGNYLDARYYLTRNREEREFYRRRADALLKKAKPLMEIYRTERKDGYYAFLAHEADVEGARHGMLVAPPLWTISDDLLERILDRNGTDEETRKAIKVYVRDAREKMSKILTHSTVFDELHAMSREEFEKYPVLLPLSDIYCKQDIAYSFEEYTEHLALMKQAEEQHENYSVDFTMSRAFRNIQIHILEGKWALVSKNKAPIVHFVIRHPQLRSALENYDPRHD